MTTEQTKQLLDNIVSGLNTGAGLLSTLSPEAAAAVTIATAVDKLIPGLVSNVQSWIEGNPPTQAELDEFAAKLAVLADPNAP